MTASELQDLLVATPVRKAGGTRRRWRIAVGPVRLHDLATHPHCNWSIAPSGGVREVAEIAQLLERFRLAHPNGLAGSRRKSQKQRRAGKQSVRMCGSQ